ncbi:CyaA/EF/ExoY family adenylyl cyclase toxin [Endozoicomonas sp. ONNA2]|uniref:CyaA/EF/ExoY family adenylyl cyclase toxin n=1 Tax=Endozoicomonas sp. ONNA2 TaxID=2828741 RepID=UPI0021477A32|nr:CyaA/EF/ExoY family adenylyl cyclase toxin [Endozoicomonas sp. ONNA2]
MAKKITTDTSTHYPAQENQLEAVNTRRGAFGNTRQVSPITEISDTHIGKGINSDRSVSPIASQKSLSESLITLADPIQNHTSRDNVITGLQRVAGHSLQGIPYDLLSRLREAADNRGAALFTRPVEPVCRTLIDEGWPTKHFRIKAKSSNWGAQAGTVPVLQQYSKLALDEDSKIEKYSKLAQKSLQEVDRKGNPYAQSVPLRISQARLEELERTGYLYQRNEQIENGAQCLYFKARACNRSDGPEHTQLLIKEPDGQWAVYDADDLSPAPVMVIAQPAAEPDDVAQPMTADIDPLMEVFPLENLDLERLDRLPIPLVSDQVVTRQVDKYRSRVKKAYAAGEISKAVLQEKLTGYDQLEKKLQTDFYSVKDESGNTLFREDSTMGNVSNRTRNMVSYYERALGRKHRVIHHNVDVHSLATDEQANYPITAFLPASLNMAEGICMIFNEEQFHTVLSELMNRGYAVQQNPLWKSRPRNNNFLNAKAIVAASLKASLIDTEEFVRGLERMARADDAEEEAGLITDQERYLDVDDVHGRRDSTASVSSSIDSVDRGSEEDSAADLSDFSDSESGDESEFDGPE